MAGLVGWHKAMFEKLGWMLLAKAKGMNEKVRAYKTGVSDLVKSLEHVMKEYEDQNRKHDLNVMLMQARLLKKNVDRML
jgi:hypothetical protein